jgi:hypothetical protein
VLKTTAVEPDPIQRFRVGGARIPCNQHPTCR